MAEKVIILEADIEIDKAVKETIKLKEEIKILEVQTAKAKEEQGELSAEYIKYSAALKTAQQDLKAQEKLNQQIIKSNIANAGSVEQMRLELSLVSKQWAELSEEERNNTEKGKQLTAEKLRLTDALKEAEKATGDYRREVGNYENATKSLKLELRENIRTLAQMKAEGKDNTAEYQALLKVTGELQDTIADTREEVKKYASDTQSLDQAIGVFKGIASAAQVAEGASALLGGENEDLQKSIQKMVAIQSVLNGVQEIGNALQKESSFMMGLNSAKTYAASAAQAVYTTAVGTSTGALKAFRTALLATGIGAIIAGVIALVMNWDKLTAAFSSSAIEAKKINDELQRTNELVQANITFDKLRLAIKKELGLAQSKITEEEIKQNKARQQELENQIDLENQLRLTLNDSEKIKEQNKKIDELHTKVIELKDEAILLNIRLEKQRKEEVEKAEEEKLNATKKAEEEKKKALDKSEEERKRRIELAKKDEEDFISFLDSINSDALDSREYIQNMIIEANEKTNNYLQEQERIYQFDQELIRQQELDRVTLDYETKKQLAEEHIFSQLEFERQSLEAKRQQELYFANQIGADTEAIKKKYDRAELELERAKTDAKLALAQDFFGNIAVIFGEQTAVGKAAAVAETTINTFRAAQGAYSSLASIPYVGPVLGIAAAAAATAAGIANVKKILKVKSGLPGDKSVSSSTPTASAPTASSASIGQGIVSRTISSGSTAQLATATNQISGNQSTAVVVVDKVTAAQDKNLAKSEMGTL